MASDLNPSAKGASSNELLAEISAMVAAQDADAFCSALGRCNLGNQERAVRALVLFTCVPGFSPLFPRFSLIFFRL